MSPILVGVTSGETDGVFSKISFKHFRNQLDSACRKLGADPETGRPGLPPEFGCLRETDGALVQLIWQTGHHIRLPR